MEILTLSSVLCASVLFYGLQWFYVTVLNVKPRNKRSVYPPGPRRWHWWIIGNILDIPKPPEYLTYSRWKSLYGDVIGLKAMGQSIIIINSKRAMRDLFELRGSKYSDRPILTVLSKWGGFGWLTAFRGYDAELRRQRQLMHRCLNVHATHVYKGTIEQESIVLASSLSRSPDKFAEHIQMMSGSSIVRAAFGNHSSQDHLLLVKLAEELNDCLKSVTKVGMHIVDLFPILSVLPSSTFGSSFACDLKRLQSVSQSMLTIPYSLVRERIAKGTASSSMTQMLIESEAMEDLAVEKSIQAAMATCYIAGADTTQSSLMTFTIAMLLYPDVQARAQREIDDLLQDERLPTLNDRPRLPYVEAVLWETLRWQAPGPLGVPHRAVQDDVYEGLHIPEGSLLIPNIWHCLHDENDYPVPEVFNPDRFVDGPRRCPDPRELVFGVGRRICPGRHFAQSNLWINVAMMLYLFDISKPTDAEEPSLEYVMSAGVAHPRPFQCNFRPRSQRRSDLLADSFARLTE